MPMASPGVDDGRSVGPDPHRRRWGSGARKPVHRHVTAPERTVRVHALDTEAMGWASVYAEKLGTSYDEMVTPDGGARDGTADVLDRLEILGADLWERQRAAEAAIRSMGVTFTLYSSEGNIDRNWPVDVIPRIITLEEWTGVSAGLVQRLHALNAFIDDLYHDQHAISDGIVPVELLADSANFRAACLDASVPGGIWAHISGSDLVRDGEGRFHVLEDNLRIPSGVSYMLENRQVSKRVFADLFRDLDILPVDGYTQQLRRHLEALSPRPGDEPIVVVLTPGIHNSAYYEHV